MENKLIKIDDIKPNSWNPNEMIKDTFNHLVNSKTWFGNLQDIIIWERNGINTIVDGEHRWKADKKNGVLEVEAKVLSTTDLLNIAKRLERLAEENKDFEVFKEIGELEGEEKAEFIAKSLTIVLNSIKGDNNPVKLAHLLVDMKTSTNNIALSTLLNVDEQVIKSYEILTQMSSEAEEQKKTVVTEPDKFKTIKMILDDDEYSLLEKMQKDTNSGDMSEAIIKASQFIMEQKEVGESEE